MHIHALWRLNLFYSEHMPLATGANHSATYQCYTRTNKITIPHLYCWMYWTHSRLWRKPFSFQWVQEDSSNARRKLLTRPKIVPLSVLHWQYSHCFVVVSGCWVCKPVHYIVLSNVLIWNKKSSLHHMYASKPITHCKKITIVHLKILWTQLKSPIFFFFGVCCMYLFFICYNI